MKKSVTVIQMEAVAHYQRMIDYARLQPPLDAADPLVMQQAIGEIWNANSCPYCRNFRCHAVDVDSACPLMRRGHCCDGVYARFSRARTWMEWIEVAEAVMAYISDHGCEPAHTCPNIEYDDVTTDDGDYIYYARIKPHNAHDLPVALQLIAAEVFNDRGYEMFDTHSLTLIRRRNDSEWLSAVRPDSGGKDCSSYTPTICRWRR